MEKRFKKVITNPATGRKKTIKYGQAGKAADGGDRIRPSKKGQVIALEATASKNACQKPSKMILIHPTT